MLRSLLSVLLFGNAVVLATKGDPPLSNGIDSSAESNGLDTNLVQSGALTHADSRHGPPSRVLARPKKLRFASMKRSNSDQQLPDNPHDSAASGSHGMSDPTSPRSSTSARTAFSTSRDSDLQSVTSSDEVQSRLKPLPSDSSYANRAADLPGQRAYRQVYPNGPPTPSREGVPDLSAMQEKNLEGGHIPMAPFPSSNKLGRGYRLPMVWQRRISDEASDTALDEVTRRAVRGYQREQGVHAHERVGPRELREQIHGEIMFALYHLHSELADIHAEGGTQHASSGVSSHHPKDAATAILNKWIKTATGRWRNESRDDDSRNRNLKRLEAYTALKGMVDPDTGALK